MSEETTNQQPPAEDNFMHSINMAFNLGVSTHQSSGQTKSVAEIVGELGNQIYENLKRGYGGEIDESFLRANVEYLLQIALMGYIIPGICAFDDGFKQNLFNLIYERAKQSRQRQSGGSVPRGGNRIIT